MWIYKGGYGRINERRIVGKQRSYLGLEECQKHCRHTGVMVLSPSIISLPIIFFNLVKKKKDWFRKVVVLTVLVLGVRIGGSSPSESSDHLIWDRDQDRIGLWVTSNLHPILKLKFHDVKLGLKPSFDSRQTLVHHFDISYICIRSSRSGWNLKSFLRTLED